MNLHLHESPRAGEADDDTIVFLHGFPFNGSMWAPQLSSLPSGWVGLAPDLRGFGSTGLQALPGEVSTGKRIGGRIARGSESVLTMARLADDVAALIAGRVEGPAVICGLSMGGYVALELWRRHPDRVRALILADTQARADDDEARENRLRMAQAARSSGTRPIAGAMMPALMAEQNRRDAALVDQVTAMIVATSAETLIAALAGMVARHDMTAELTTIAVPTLVIAGDEDSITPPGSGRRMAHAIPRASFLTIPDAGHLSNLENSAAFNQGLEDFLAQL